MAKSFNSVTMGLSTSESDIYVATGSKSMTLLVQVVNSSLNAVECELWITNGSNTHLFPILPPQLISSVDGVRDVAKHIILDGYKIRGKASTSSAAYVEISVIEGA